MSIQKKTNRFYVEKNKLDFTNITLNVKRVIVRCNFQNKYSPVFLSSLNVKNVVDNAQQDVPKQWRLP
jgi:hypothetical protein